MFILERFTDNQSLTRILRNRLNFIAYVKMILPPPLYRSARWNLLTLFNFAEYSNMGCIRIKLNFKQSERSGSKCWQLLA
jgi:hypothetical protein